MNADMNTDPQQIRDQVDAVLAGLPDIDPESPATAPADGGDDDVDVAGIEQVGRRLEEAHQILVDALESVEKG